MGPGARSPGNWSSRWEAGVKPRRPGEAVKPRRRQERQTFRKRPFWAVTSTFRTAGCGPARPVVWEGSSENQPATPYPDSARPGIGQVMRPHWMNWSHRPNKKAGAFVARTGAEGSGEGPQVGGCGAGAEHVPHVGGSPVRGHETILLLEGIGGHVSPERSFLHRDGSLVALETPQAEPVRQQGLPTSAAPSIACSSRRWL